MEQHIKLSNLWLVHEAVLLTCDAGVKQKSSQALVVTSLHHDASQFVSPVI